MVTVFGEALRSISAILNTCVREAFFPDGTVHGWNTNLHSKTNEDLFIFVPDKNMLCSREENGGRERQTPISVAASPSFIV